MKDFKPKMFCQETWTVCGICHVWKGLSLFEGNKALWKIPCLKDGLLPTSDNWLREQYRWSSTVLGVI